MINKNFEIERLEKIRKMIPEEVKSVLDVGCKDCYFRNFFPKYVGIDVNEKCDIKQDLLKISRLSFPKKTFDIVILSQILEHLAFFEELIKESKRVTKKYILIGLPNDFTYDIRIRYLFSSKKLIHLGPYGHKHTFNENSIEKFILKYFGKYEKKWPLFGSTGGRYMPNCLKNFLASLHPNLFAKEIYYLIKIK